MSSERIEELHEKASEDYLNGNYAGALQAWRDILALDPDNGPAQDGADLAAQFVEPPVEPATHAEIESALDQKLSGRDHDAAPVAASHPDPRRQAEDIDLEDLSSVAVVPIGPPSPDTDHEAAPEGWEPAQTSSEEVYGLEPALPSARLPDNPALMELHRRVDDLLAQARVKAEAGERDEALAILHRVAILDEDNARAAALRASLESSAASHLDTIEKALIEGVAALEADRLNEAEACFKAALALAPDHRELLHYMETVRARREGPPPGAPSATYDELLGSGDLLGDLPPIDLAAPGMDAPAVRRTESMPFSEAAPEPAAARAPRVAAPAALAPPRDGLIWRREVILGGVGIVALLCALGWIYLRGGSHARPGQVPFPAVKRPLAAKPVPAKPSVSAPGGPASPEDRAKAAVAAIARGRSQMAASEFAAAIVSFNAARNLDPISVDARNGLHDAGEKFRAVQAEHNALDSIRLAFRDGEYTSGLRMAYRLPPTVPAAASDGIKAAGWYDLAVVALRAGDCREASGHLDEVLTIAPHDADAARLKDFAKLYAEAPKDRRFLDFVEALQFRNFP